MGYINIFHKMEKNNYLNSFFDKIYLLNLDRRNDRFFNIQNHLDKRKIKYIRFSAIDYRNLEIKNKIYHKKFTIKEHACLLSHLEIIKEAKKYNYNNILILEDDIIFHKEFNKYTNILNEIPETWDLIYFGCGQRENCNDVKKKKPFYKANKSRGTYAYGINKNIYDNLLNLLNNGIYGVLYPIDILLNKIQLKGYSYVIYDNLIISDVSNSDISNKRDMNKYCLINDWDISKYDLFKYNNLNLFDNNKIVQSLWIGERLSLMERLCIKSFISRGHEFHLYVYNKIDNIPNNCVIKNGKDILSESEIFYYKKSSTKDGKSANSVSAFSNLFRYKLLYEKGGYWVDMDMICMKYLNFVDDYVFSSEEDKYILKFNKLYLNPRRNKQIVNAGIIKCPPKSEFAEYCYNTCLKKKREKNLKWGLGPKIIKLGIIKFNFKKYVKPYYYFCPIDHRDVIDINTAKKINISMSWYCIHLWNECWKRNNMNKEDIKNDSLYYNLNNLYT
jgi:GR25 family glycosyltransferase involved in LPS biosynthesis